MIELTGHIEVVTYSSDETGFTIARVKPDDGSGIVTVVGPLMAPPPGTPLKMQGDWTTHPKFGRQFKVVHFKTVAPTTTTGIRKYLGSGLIPGLGAKMAERIVTAFGKNTLEIIEHDITRLEEVEGIGKKRVALIKKAWDDQKEIRDVMIFLQSHGVSTGFATKIYKQYEGRSIDVVSGNPYCLATDINGIGFKTADTIAASIGFAKDSPFRINSGIVFSLRSMSERGHVYYPYTLLVDETVRLLGVSPAAVENGIEQLTLDKTLILDTCDGSPHGDPAVYLAPHFFCERGAAEKMKAIMRTPLPGKTPVPAAELSWVQKRLGISLAPKQAEAVKKALVNKTMVITGGPGTGKTTIINAILKIASRHNLKILLTAPTGRAAKRMNETTGLPAKTIHRLLEFSFKAGGFQKNDDAPLNCDMLIVDEASMIDINLMFHLLKAIPLHAVLILVGDVCQLPSVGPGNVLNDIIESGAVPVVKLSEIFRQARQSSIIVNAHKINSGIIPASENNTPGDDYYFIEQADPEKMLDIIKELVKTRIPRRFNHDSFDDIQVLTPMHKGPAGSDRLNRVLQEHLNGNGPSLTKGDALFRVNDKVMQLRNNYDKDVFNGDIGRVCRIDPVDRTMSVKFDDKEILYQAGELDEIALAYAISVHKSQGSEYPAVIIPVTTQHYILLQRNLIYTGITRGRNLVVLVGTKKALAMAVKNNKTAERYTHLKYRLRS